MPKHHGGYIDTVAHHESRIRNVLRWAYDNEGWEPVTDRTPLDDLIAEEVQVELDAEAVRESFDWPSSDQPELRIEALKQDEAAQIAEWARRRLVHWLFGEGVHPFKLLQRLYALAFARYPELIGPLNGHWLAEILGQGRGAFSALMQRLFNVPVEAKTGQLMTVGGQKNAESREKYAENAREKKPRRQINGSGLTDADREEDARRHRDERRKLLQRQLVEDRKKQDRENEEFFKGAKARREEAESANSQP